MMNDPANIDKSQRSVFVGNIPYEATEEKLKEIFSEVGPVASFKLVYDRENGKPKGYGFCEYADAGTALSAMRNLNGYEIGGRTLRVDNACTEKNREMELQQMAGPGGPMAGPGAGPGGVPGMVGGMGQENVYGDAMDPEKAPESISKAVASLPPENMFELMKQMQQCIQNNPQEARVMLNQNPQLAYALLQAQVVMRIVDPDFALSMLHKNPPKTFPNPHQPPQNPMHSQQQQQQQAGPGMAPFQQQQQPPPQRPQMFMGGGPGPGMPPMGGGGGPPMQRGGMNMPMDGPPQGRGGPYFGGGGGGNDRDMGGRGGGFNPDSRGFNEPNRPPIRDPREDRFGGGRDSRERDPREERFGGRDPRSRDPRGGGGFGDRGSSSRQGPSNPLAAAAASVGGGARGGGPPPSAADLPPHLAGADPEKATLIKQVLMLTDEQIALLPGDQRDSIMQLKKQINIFN